MKRSDDSFRGFIGCLRSLRLNNQVLDLHKETEHVENNEVHLSCPDKCHSDLCKNEAECLENLSVSLLLSSHHSLPNSINILRISQPIPFVCVRFLRFNREPIVRLVSEFKIER